MKPRTVHFVGQFSRLRYACSTVALIAGFGATILAPNSAKAIDDSALPSGGEVVGGGAALSYEIPNELHVYQDTERAVINWNSFNIGTDAIAEFHQPDSQSLTVNRVLADGQDPSQILGQLKSNGHVMVLDRNGVIFGKNAVIDVGGIIVSTGDVDPTQVMNGDLIEIEDIDTAGAILNNGLISAEDSGLVALVAPTVINNGVITAKLGRVEMAAGSKATIDLYGDGLVELSLEEGRAQTLVNNGIISSDGGHIQIKASAAKDVVDNVVLNTGIVAANSVKTSEGKIVLYAEGVNTSEAQGNSVTANDGYITAAGYKDGEHGGSVEVLGDIVLLEDDSVIDASGDLGGGDIKVGGDYLGTGDTPTAIHTSVDKESVILNDAVTNGDGGRTIVWSDHTTDFKGSIYARGGKQAGDGGFVETSGKENLLAQGYVDLTAENGHKGTYLLDPSDITIYGNFDPSDVANLEAWFDASDKTTITLGYSTDGLGGATASGTLGTNTITTSIDVSGSLEVGARIRLAGAGAVTTADTQGADTYTITGIAGTTITVAETLTSTYTADALYRGLVNGWSNKAGAEVSAQGTDADKPLWLDNTLNSNGVLSFDGVSDYLTAGDVFDIRTNDRSAFSVFNFDDATNGSVYANSYYSGADGRYSLLRSGGNLTTLFDIGAANNNVSLAFASTAYTQSSTVTERGAQNSFYVNGAFQGDIAIAADFQDENPGNHFLTGVYNNVNGIDPRPGFYLNGHVSEIVLYNDNVSASSRVLVEQYQSAKWGVALDPIAGAGLEAAEAMDSTNGYGVFTTRYLERLSNSADIVLQASNSITMDLQGDTLALANDRNLSLTTTNGPITDVSAGTIQTNRTGAGGNISITAGGAGDVTLDTTTFNTQNGGVVNLSAGGNVSLITPGSINLGTVSGTNISVRTTGATSDITLNNNVVSTAAGNSLVLASGDDFINNVGGAVLNAGAGRWLVYSANPADNTLNGLSANFKRYNRSYAGYGPGSVAESNNGFLYSIAPTINITAQDKTREYGDANPAFTITSSGLIDGDTFGTAVTGSAAFTAAGVAANAGTSAITPTIGTLASALRYQFSFTAGQLTITQAPLTVTADDKTIDEGDAIPTLTGSITGFKLADTIGDLDVVPSYSTTATSGSSAGTYAITAAAASDVNYSFSYVDGELTIGEAAGDGIIPPSVNSIMSNAGQQVSGENEDQASSVVLQEKAEKDMKNVSVADCLVTLESAGCVIR